MFILKRKEVFIGNFKGYIKCTNILAENNIKYDYKIINRSNNQLPQVRSGVDYRIYYAYANKNDYNKAIKLL